MYHRTMHTTSQPSPVERLRWSGSREEPSWSFARSSPWALLIKPLDPKTASIGDLFPKSAARDRFGGRGRHAVRLAAETLRGWA